MLKGVCIPQSRSMSCKREIADWWKKFLAVLYFPNMDTKKVLLAVIGCVVIVGHCLAAGTEAASKNQEVAVGYSIENKGQKFFIGLPLRTNNEECSLAMPAHKERFFKEKILERIPNKSNNQILALYTDYEGDYTKPYSWILGCEVSTLDEVPEGLVGKVIPPSKYAVFTTKGMFPQGLLQHGKRFGNRICNGPIQLILRSIAAILIHNQIQK
jgi:predicted transcriptional regulator YdeE